MIRLLIVDDHPAFRMWARLMLTADGFEVVGEAGGVAHALDEIGRVRPDAILLDVQLPDGDGFEVAALVADRAGSPLVVMTSSRDAAAYAHDLERTGLRFIPKSDLSADTLRAALGAAA